MKFLFVHQAFPAQFAHIARHLAVDHQVVAISRSRAAAIAGARNLHYRPSDERRDTCHRRFARNGEAVAAVAERLKREGFHPDLIVGHTAWGEVLCLKQIWPRRPLLGYFELYDLPLRFDPEVPPTARDVARSVAHNEVDRTCLGLADAGVSPTRFQRSSYPQHYWKHLEIIHEGIDTRVLRPDPQIRIRVGRSVFVPGDEVVTYCARSLEPHRGFHVFMRALPRLLGRRPNAHVFIVGRGRHCYSPAPVGHRSYAHQLMDEISGTVDRSRIHFLGHLPRAAYRAVLRLSAAHVYLTYPFALSWSLLEAMSSGCLVVGSRTPPVEEVIVDGHNGLLVDFFDGQALAKRLCEALADQTRFRGLRATARQTVIDRYDLHSVCLPAHLRLYARLTGRTLHSPAPTRHASLRQRPAR